MTQQTCWYAGEAHALLMPLIMTLLNSVSQRAMTVWETASMHNYPEPLINLIIYTCAFPLLWNSQSQIGTSFFILIQAFADLLHSGSRTAAPRRTCRSWSGRGAGRRSGTCCETRRWSSCTGAAPCLDSPRGAKGWRCHTLGCAWNSWNLKENTNVQETNHLDSKQVFVSGFSFLLSLCFVALGVGWEQMSFFLKPR